MRLFYKNFAMHFHLDLHAQSADTGEAEMQNPKTHVSTLSTGNNASCFPTALKSSCNV